MEERINGRRKIVLIVVLLCVYFMDLVYLELPEEEVVSLAVLYGDTNGDSWYNRKNWLTGDPCENEWWGVGCDDTNSTVLSLNLRINGMDGVVPMAIAGLRNLEEWTTPQNQLRGEATIEALSTLVRLKSLDLRDNVISGTLPSVVDRLSVLQYLNVGNNQLLGSLPSLTLPLLQDLTLDLNALSGSIGDITKLGGLQKVRVASNKFSGSLPANLWPALPDLVYLDLADNQMSSTIPSSLANITNLRFLDLSGNSFTGSTEVIFSCSTLLEVELSNNQFGGTIPCSIGNLAEMRSLSLANNAMYGALPSELGAVTRMKFLRLSNNGFSGSLPAALSSMRKLELFEAGENAFTSLPEDFFLLPELHTLRVPWCNLAGTLSENITSSLKYLDLGHNFIYGTLPDSIAALPSLMELWLGDNRIGGTLPVFQLPNINVVSLERNEMSGSPCEAMAGLVTSSKKLQHLGLQDNLFSGSLCIEFGEISRAVQTLYLGRNQFSGSIPSELMPDFRSMVKVIDLSHNELSGTLPEELDKTYSLETFLVRDNMLTGTIPKFLGSYSSNLINLDLAKNGLEGNIPKTLNGLNKLRVLLLSHNRLSGTIDAIFEGLTSLDILDLSFNSFWGTLPEFSLLMPVSDIRIQHNAITDISSLVRSSTVQVFNASHNLISGDFPPINQMPQLSIFDVSNNNVTGTLPEYTPLPFSTFLLHTLVANNNFISSTIPPSLLVETSLTEINLGRNELTGVIPPVTGGLIHNADLSSNYLSGPVPQWPVDESLLLADNLLIGFLGEWICSVPVVDVRGNRFYCPLPSCCSGGTKFCDSTCVVYVGNFFDAPWRLVYVLVGALLAVALFLAFVFFKGGVAEHLKRRLGYGTLGSATVQNIEFIGELGAGYHGDVRKGLWMGTTVVAVKSLGDVVPGTKHDFEAEARLLLSVRHPNVLQFLGIYHGKTGDGLVTEFMHMGSLDNVLYQRDLVVPVETRVTICGSLSAGIAYLHHRGIIHRDIAARNVLIKQEQGELVPKIGDFGHARLLNEEGFYIPPTTEVELLAFKWCAPEIFSQRFFSPASDIFAFGVTIWEIFNDAEEPWPGLDVKAVRAKVWRGQPLPKTALVTSSLHNEVIAPCADVRPGARPTAGQLHKHFGGIFQRSSSSVSEEEPLSEVPQGGGLYVYSSQVFET